MEIKEFENERNEKIAEFQKTYNFLKTQYSSTLLAAIQEKDPEQQQQLVSRVLQVNTDLSEAIRETVSDMNKGTESISSTTLDKLTQDLIDYQKQYQDIQDTKNKVETLKRIYSTDKQKLNDISFMYNVYLFALIVVIFIVIVLVIRTPVSSVIQNVASSVASLGQSQ
jgi:ABC-type Na+ efflux pump permease subunit